MPIRVKDHSKCNEWERRRRDRLNDAFKNLAQLLPHHDPAKIPPKIEILDKSTEFVKELRLSNSRLLSNQVETDEKCKLIKQLQDEVNRLILRVKQLTVLLKKANITIPTGPEIKSLGSKRMKWSGKLTLEDVENSVISNGASLSDEIVPSSEKDIGLEVSAASNGTISIVSNIATQPSNGIKTNSSSINTSVASIIVPLKETNLSKTNSCDTIAGGKTIAAESRCTTATSSPVVITSSISPLSSSFPTPTTSSRPLLCSTQSSPIKVITTSDPIFTTANATPIQLPLQTFIIAPCPITGSTQATALPTQHSQYVTRITNILPAPILPQTIEGIALQKIPIKSLLRPIPKVIKRRKRKKKNEKLLTNQTTKESRASTGAERVQSENPKLPEKNETTFDKIDILASSKDTATAGAEENVVPFPSPSRNLEEENTKDKENEESAGKECSKEGTTEESDMIESFTSALEKASNSQETTDVYLTKIIEITQDHEAIDIREEEPKPKIAKKSEVGPSSKNIITITGIENSESLSSKKSPESKNIVATTDSHECENIPVLRIIEAPDQTNDTRDNNNVLSTIVIENNEDQVPGTDQITTNNERIPAIPADSAEGKESRTFSEVAESVVEKTQVEVIAEIPSISCTRESDTSLSAQSSLSNNGEPATCPKSNCEDILVAVSMESIKNHKEKEQPVDEIVEDANRETMDIFNYDKESKDIAESSTVEVSPRLEVLSSARDKDANNTTLDVSVNAESVSVTCTVGSIFEEVNSEPNPTPLPTIQEVTSVIMEVPLEETQKKVEKSTHIVPPSLASLDQFSKINPEDETITPSKEKEESSTTGVSFARKGIMDIADAITTTDKISECIARSIDLIDANDSELMALGEHWEDSGASPKSISPTQIFLNIFPLLPKDSAASEPQQHHHQVTFSLPQTPTASTSQTPKNPITFTTSSNSRSSFLIDAMLPDDHSTNTNAENTDAISSSAHSPFLPLTPPQYSSTGGASQQISSPFSLSSNYYWPPPAIPSSSSTDTAIMDFRPTSSANAFSLHEIQRTGISNASFNNSAPITTASTFTSIPSTKPSTVITSTSATTPILSLSVPVTTNSKTKSSNSENQRSSSSKRSKSSADNSGKLAFMFETNLPTFSKSKTTKTTTSTSTSVTWSVTTTAATPTTQTSTFQQHNPVTTVPSMDAIGHVSSTPVSSNTQQVPFHSCSLLDALNPMDASFFRPLINALDSHDFRSLDFTGTNTLAPPPPTLPPLMPPPPSTKPIYSAQFSNTPQSAQNSANVSSYPDHQAAAFMQQHHHHHHHHQPVQLFSSSNNVPLIPSTPSLGSKHQYHKPTQQYNSSISSQESQPPPILKPAKPQSSTSTTDKTSRTSGRQKSDSKQSRSGKSSRTQPYVIPSSTSQPAVDHKQSQKQDNNHTPVATTLKAPALTHSFHTIHSHIHSSTNNKHTGLNSSRSYGFQNIQSSSHFETSETAANTQKYKTSGTGHLSEHAVPPQRPQATKSTTESKSHKSKESKSQTSHSSSNTKPSSRSSQNSLSGPAPTSSSQSQGNSAVPSSSKNSNSLQLSGKGGSTGIQQQADPIRPNVETVLLKSVQHNTNINATSSSQTQVLQTPVESFQLFPEYTPIGASGNSRQSGAHGHSHQYHHHDTSILQQQPDQSHSMSNFPIQRAHPYYFPDITSSFENFSPAQHNQGQSQPPLAASQAHNSAINRNSAVSEGNSNYTQSQTLDRTGSSTKFTYESNNATTANNPAPSSSVLASNQREFHHHVQHQPTASSRQHQNYFLQEDIRQSYTSNNQQASVQQPSVQHHHASPAVLLGESQRHLGQLSVCQQQVQQVKQSRNTTNPSHNRSTTSTSTTETAPVSSGKGKQQQQHTAPAMAFQSYVVPHQPQPQLPHPHQPQLQQIPQSTHHHHQNLPQATSRASSKTVNWMTDTGYRSTSTATSASTASNKLQTSAGTASTNNPFSVSKLVGNSSGPGHSKPQLVPVSANTIGTINSTKTQQHQPTSSQNNNVSNATANRNNNKSSRNVVSSSAATVHSQSQNQSNYCAEALIRKNPAPPSTDWINDFNLVASTNQNYHGSSYPDTHHHHSSSHIHTNQHHHQNTASEQFPTGYSNISGGTYHHYPTAAGGGSVAPSSNPSHFPHFDHTQPQYSTVPVPPHRDDSHHHQNTVQTSSSNYDPGHQRLHNTQPHSSHMQVGHTIHYPQHQHHHHHHQVHHPNQHSQSHGSSSSVTNFNLSTIFPEINDKRSNNNSSNSLGGQIPGGTATSGNNSNSNTAGGIGPGNMNSACSYHHSNFGNPAEGPGSMR